MFRHRRIVACAALILLIGGQISAQETPTPSPAPESITYTVRSGDTLGAIAARYGVTVTELMQINNLSSSELIVLGQTLDIPVMPTPAPRLDETLIPLPDLATPTPADLPLVNETPIPIATNVINPAFDYGIEVMFDGQDVGSLVRQVTALGMDWTKVRVSWRALEPSKGDVDFTRTDLIVSALEARHENILLTVADAPDWARAIRLENGPPDDFADYADFIWSLAVHYAGRIQAYEIWNEPNLRREWNSLAHPLGADSYADLLRQAYAAVKAADPAALVISAGLAPTGYDDGVNAVDDRAFLMRLYQLGLADISDAVSAHPFGFANPPDAVCCAAPDGVATHYGHPSFYFLDTLNDYHQIMQANGDLNTLIWITAFGWGSSEDSAAPPLNSIYFSYTTLDEQAKNTARAFELAANLGFVGTMIVYNLNGCDAQPENAEACYYSLIAPSGQPRPVYNMLSLMFASAGTR